MKDFITGLLIFTAGGAAFGLGWYARGLWGRR